MRGHNSLSVWRALLVAVDKGGLPWRGRGWDSGSSHGATLPSKTDGGLCTWRTRAFHTPGMPIVRWYQACVLATRC